MLCKVVQSLLNAVAALCESELLPVVLNFQLNIVYIALDSGVAFLRSYRAVIPCLSVRVLRVVITALALYLVS